MLLVEDDRSLRAMLRLLVQDCKDVDVVGEAADGREAVALARHFQPDVVLLDLAMPGMGALKPFPSFSLSRPPQRSSCSQALEPVEVADLARDKGAVGYFQKGDDLGRLVSDLDRILEHAS